MIIEEEHTSDVQKIGLKRTLKVLSCKVSIMMIKNLGRYFYHLFSSTASSFCTLVILILLLHVSEYGGSTERALAQSGKNYSFLMELDENSDIISQPEGIDTDAEGNIYVNDIGDNQIKKFNKDGVLVSEWGSTGDEPGQFKHPHGNKIEIADSGIDRISMQNESEESYIYITDQNNYRIQKFTTDGTFTTMWGEQGEGDQQFLHIHGIDLDSDGNLYVSDRDQPSIQKFTTNGTFTKKWGAQGTLEGQFIQPWDVKVSPDNKVFVPDFGNDRIQIFTTDGNFIASWGTSGTELGQFNGPAGIAFDSAGNVYVTDSGNQRVQIFSNNGTYLSSFGENGEGNGQFSRPESITVDDSSGRVYVSDTSNHNVQIFGSLIDD
jgi:tripartite motif-containing protein 71